MNLINMAGAAAAAMMVTAVMPRPTAGEGLQDRAVTVIGCAVKGDGDGDGFLLVNTVERTTVGAISASPSGAVTVNETTTTALKPARVLYWLDDDDDVVNRLMGQTVEITGEIEGDIQPGEIKAERENGMIELEIDADGRKATVTLADVPSAIGSPNAVSDRETDLPYVVQKLDVKSARSVSPTCR